MSKEYKQYAIADIVPKDCADFISAGKEYEVLDTEPEGDIKIFCFKADDGIRTWANFPPAPCDLLDEKIWRVVKGQPQL